MKVIIALGSNLEKERNLPEAIERLRNHPAMQLLSRSPIYETPAIDRFGLPSDQPVFHNGAVLVETSLTPRELRTELRRIEAEMGRVRTADKFAPRPIDLDITMIGSATVTLDETLDDGQIPDEDILRHPHVALPLADIAPHWVHPVAGVTLGQIAANLAATETEIIRL